MMNYPIVPGPVVGPLYNPAMLKLIAMIMTYKGLQIIGLVKMLVAIIYFISVKMKKKEGKK